MDGVSTRFQNFFAVKITIYYEESLFFRVFFSKPPSILVTDSKKAYSKIVGYPFQDQLLIIQ